MGKYKGLVVHVTLIAVHGTLVWVTCTYTRIAPATVCTVDMSPGSGSISSFLVEIYLQIDSEFYGRLTIVQYGWTKLPICTGSWFCRYSSNGDLIIPRAASDTGSWKSLGFRNPLRVMIGSIRRPWLAKALT